MPRSRRRKVSRWKRMMPTLLALLILAGMAAAAGTRYYIDKYAPTKALADQAAYFGVSGDETAVYLNDEKQLAQGQKPLKAYTQNGQVYLPLSFVEDEINQRFYWDESRQALLYTLPEQTVELNMQTNTEAGAPVLLERDKTLYLNLATVRQYTDVRLSSFLDGLYKRVFINTEWGIEIKSTVRQESAVRLQGGVKSPILTMLAAGDSVRVLESMERWSRIVTGDGFIGYVRNKELKDRKEEKPVSQFQKPEYRHQFLENQQKVLLGFHQVTNAVANGKLADVLKQVKGMNVLAPTWFAISDNEGGLRSFADAAYVKQAHDKGLKVWATFNNFDAGEVDEKELLSQAKFRAKLIEGLMAEAEKSGLDGINVDIELLPQDAGRDYLQFMRELSLACHQKGLTLSVDSYVPYSYNAYYDLKELSVFCDYVIIMCYDEHYAGSEPGSVSSLPYLMDGINGGSALVNTQQLVIALPFYTRIWKEKGEVSSSEALSVLDAQKWLDDNAVKLSWDAELGQDYGQLVQGDTTYRIWMENAKSMKAKVEQVRKAGVGGIACWKLGQEPAEFWDILRGN